MSSSTAGIDTQTVSESLDLGVAAHRVALASSSTAPCDIYSASASATMDANSRVCLMLNTTDEDSESYVAFLKTATVRNLDSGLEYALLTKAYHDYFTFFLPRGSAPARAPRRTSKSKWSSSTTTSTPAPARPATRELQVAANEDAAVLQLGASNPSLAEEGTAGVDLKLELDGLPLDDYLASGDVDEPRREHRGRGPGHHGDQVELTGVAASADGIFVQIHVSGIDDAGATLRSAARRATDVASGATALPPRFKKAIVASVADVTSTDQVKNVRAVEASRRRKLEAGALVEYTVVAAQTLRDAGADYAATYLSEFVAGVAAAADDGLFVQVLQQGGQVFAGVAARKTNAAVPPVVEAETAKAPEV
ncbi:hypothetical protein SO694_00008361 [Aureococcus anophagefferens]|uniref:RGS domain-containing protein n=1 Tax=Aureococcus anophagefferens TaxID=44056 RepID=A0ABR1GE77_AURAN